MQTRGVAGLAFAALAALLPALSVVADEVQFTRSRDPRHPRARSLAGSDCHRSDQPRLRPARRGRARRAPVLRHPAVRQREVLVRHLPRARAQLDRQPRARRRRGRGRPQHADPDERAARPLVRLGRRAPTACGRRASGRSSTRASWARPRATSPSSMRKDDELSCRYRRSLRRRALAHRRRRGPGQRRQDPRRVPGDVRDARRRPSTASATRSRAASSSKAGLYSEAAQRGLRIFVGKGNCSELPQRAEFHQRRVPQQRLLSSGRPGGVEGLKAVRAKPLQPGRDATTTTRRSASHATQEPDEAGAFKVPTLRHLMLTAPYGHDGKRETLAEVVRHYSEQGSGDAAAAEAHRRPSRPTSWSSWSRSAP